MSAPTVEKLQAALEEIRRAAVMGGEGGHLVTGHWLIKRVDRALEGLEAEADRGLRAYVERCDEGHHFAKLAGSDHRCPVCLAMGLELARGRPVVAVVRTDARDLVMDELDGRDCHVAHQLAADEIVERVEIGRDNALDLVLEKLDRIEAILTISAAAGAPPAVATYDEGGAS